MADFKLPWGLKEKIPGIYVIVDLSETKAYVGSSVELPRRLYTHHRKLETNTHPNWQLQRAHNKGNDLVCLPIPVGGSESTLQLEQQLLDEFVPHERMMNVAVDATAPTLGRVFGEDTRMKVSLAGKGRRHTDESKEKIRQGHLGKKKNFSDEGALV